MSDYELFFLVNNGSFPTCCDTFFQFHPPALRILCAFNVLAAQEISVIKQCRGATLTSRWSFWSNCKLLIRPFGDTVRWCSCGLSLWLQIYQRNTNRVLLTKIFKAQKETSVLCSLDVDYFYLPS